METLGIRWTVGNVAPAGFEALNLSICGAARIFGAAAEYTVCFNSISKAELRDRLGELPVPVDLHESTEELPTSIRKDVRPCFGQFTGACGATPRNSGIRGLPPDWDLEAALLSVLEQSNIVLQSELDEQGLQVAAVSQGRRPHVVSTRDVTICSPFPPHLPYLGRCGAHFVGLNAKSLPWSFYGRPAVEYIQEFWKRQRPLVEEEVGVPLLRGNS